MENKTKTKPLEAKRTSIPTNTNKNIKEKQSKDDLDSSHLSSNNNTKSDTQLPSNTLSSPSNAKNGVSLPQTTQELIKIENFEKNLSGNSNENSFLSQNNTIVQNNPNSTTNASSKSKKKESILNSPKTGIVKENSKSTKLNTPTKTIKSKDKADCKKTDLNDSPHKLGGQNPNSSLDNVSDDSVNNSRSHSAKRKDHDIAGYYKKEKGKLNIWTYLFTNLNKSINEIYSMCEMENIMEYNNGVISTLESAIEDLKKLNRKIELENIKEQRPLAWDIPGNTYNEITNQQDLENFVEDLEDPENVDFTLLSQLIYDGKMSFNEAIVLLVRERALLVDDISNNLAHFNSDNGSFISKTTGELLLDYQRDLKDTKDESIMAPISITHESQDILRRSRSQTPGRVSLAKIITRLNWKLMRQTQTIEENDEERTEEFKNNLKEKLSKAEKNRKDLEESKLDIIKKETWKIERAREKLAEKQSKKWELVSKKLDEAEERYEAQVTKIKRKAQNENEKVNEIAFITLLENQSKKLTLDQKLKETHERRFQIIEKIKQKQSERNQKEEAVLKRKEAIEKESKKLDVTKIRSKLEDAENRRNKILEEKKKLTEEEKRKLNTVNEKKKRMLDLYNRKETINDSLKQRITNIKEKFKEQEKINTLDYMVDENNDELSFTSLEGNLSSRILKKSQSLILDTDDYVPLDELPIVFYEPKLKKIAEKVASQQINEVIKKHKKKKKTKEKKIIDTDEMMPSIIRSFSDPVLKVAKASEFFPKEDQIQLKQNDKKDNKFGNKEKNEPGIVQAKSPRDSKENKQLKSMIQNPNDKKLSKLRTSGELTSIADDKKSTKAISFASSKKEIKDECILQFPKEPNVTPSLWDKAVTKKSEDEESDEEEKRLEKNDVELGDIVQSDEISGETIRWCSICDLILQNDVPNDDHISSKAHRKTKTQYNLTSSDDINCIFEFKSSDASAKLKAERLNTLKKRCKKVKQRLLTKALKHENACIVGKEVTSQNKQRLQKLCSDLDRQLANQIKDYELVENTLKDILKFLEIQRESDLHIMRQLKFIPLLMEICKKVPLCHKNEMSALLKVLDSVIKILSKFCGLIDNRSYMILTNRLVPVVDLLIWCLNRPTKFVYSLAFVPQLFTILGRHLNHRLPIENIGYREDLIEYIFCSGMIFKLQQKFMSFKGGLDLTTSMGKVPLALLKSVSFLETLTSVLDAEHDGDRTIFDPSNISENVALVLKETEYVGMFSLLASLLLSDTTYLKTQNKALPQTVLSLSMTTIKFFNNISRLMIDPVQKLLGSEVMQEQVYHVFSYILSYCNDNYDSSEDVKDLLDELLLLMGYFAVLNPTNQRILAKGTSSLIQKLSAMPFQYFTDKRLKDVLFPTIFSAIYGEERNLEILYQEVSKDHLIKYLQAQIQMHPIDQKDSNEEQNMNSIKNDSPPESKMDDKSRIVQEQKYIRAPSVSSNNSSTTSLFNVKSSNSLQFALIRRFPRKEWENLLQFINSK